MKTKTIVSIIAAAVIAVSCCQTGNTCTNGGVKKDIAVQLYSVRSLIGAFGNEASDYKPLLDTLASMGYTAIEAASYADGKLYGTDPAQFKADVEAAGLEVLSSHCNKYLSEKEIKTGDYSESLKWWDQCIAAHKAAGMKYLVMPYLGVPSTIKELQAYCDYFNQVGKKCKENGISFGYHNHAHEFQKVEDKEVMEGLRAHFTGECTEVGMYLAMARVAEREGYPEVAEAYKRYAYEEAEHAAKFAELLGEVVTDSTKKNLEMRAAAEAGACEGKLAIAKRAKELGYDAIHDTVHEMAKDEARHGAGFAGLLKRYFNN